MRVLCLILSALIVSAYAQSANDSTSTATKTDSTTPGTTRPTTTTTTTIPITQTTKVVTPAAATNPATPKADPATSPKSNAPPTEMMPVEGPAAQGYWSLNDTETNHSCIIVTMAMQFNFTYMTGDNMEEFVVHNLEPDATVYGFCNESLDVDSMSISLAWNNTFNLTITFEKMGTGDWTQTGLSQMELWYNLTDEFFPGTSEFGPQIVYVQDMDKADASEFVINKGGSYRCKEPDALEFRKNGTNSSEPWAVLGTISEFQFQALSVPKDNTISDNYQECAADFSTSDIVPIAVGCALAALVVIVLIAYLIGRRRSRQKGYQSV